MLISLSISRLLIRVDMPDDIVWQSIDTVASSVCHFSKAFGFRLVLKGVAREVDSRTMNICLYDDVDTTDTVEGYFLVLVCAPITHFGHVLAVGGVLLVTCTKLEQC